MKTNGICPDCGGKGTVSILIEPEITDICDRCGGTGQVDEQELQKGKKRVYTGKIDRATPEEEQSTSAEL